LAALRFFYVKTLRRAWSVADTLYPKKAHHLPTVLSREEVAQLLRAARTPRQRILLTTLYATGARCAELTHLKVNDIDSQRMVVHIRGGKGRKDRLWAAAHKRSDVPACPPERASAQAFPFATSPAGFLTVSGRALRNDLMCREKLCAENRAPSPGDTGCCGVPSSRVASATSHNYRALPG